MVARALLMRYLRALAPQDGDRGLPAGRTALRPARFHRRRGGAARQAREGQAASRQRPGSRTNADHRRSRDAAAGVRGDAEHRNAASCSDALRADAMAKAVERHDRCSEAWRRSRRWACTWPAFPGARASSGSAAGSPWRRSRRPRQADGRRPELLENRTRTTCGRSPGAWRSRASCCTSSMRTSSRRLRTRERSRRSRCRSAGAGTSRCSWIRRRSAATPSRRCRRWRRSRADATSYPERRTGVDKVLADMQGSYTLGFYMPDDPDDKWHKLKVQVKRSGAERAAPRRIPGGFARGAADDSGRTTRGGRRSPIRSGRPAIPLTVSLQEDAFRRRGGDGPRGHGRAAVRAGRGESEGDLEILIGDRTAEGPGRSTRSAITAAVPAAQWEVARQQPTRYEGTWKPAADATTLRVIVHDVNSGRYGSLDVPLSKVPRDRPN